MSNIAHRKCTYYSPIAQKRIPSIFTIMRECTVFIWISNLFGTKTCSWKKSGYTNYHCLQETLQTFNSGCRGQSIKSRRSDKQWHRWSQRFQKDCWWFADKPNEIWLWVCIWWKRFVGWEKVTKNINCNETLFRVRLWIL